MAVFAAAQLNACADPQRNLEKIAAFAAEAAGRADLLLCPEYAMGYPDRGGAPVPGQPLDGPFVTGLRELARARSRGIGGGAVEERHRKNHLYDAFSFRESDRFTPGSALFEPLDTDFGRIGLLVCYELRFPEAARLQALAGAEYLLTAAAFVCGEGKAHAWHALLAARALENGCFVIGADHVKRHVFLGESAAYGPNSVALGALDGAREGLLFAECPREAVARYRESCPSLSQRRDDLYRLEALHFS